MRRFDPCGWLALFALGLPAAAQTVIHVPAGAPTIQDGILAAGEGDTVRVAPGTYEEVIDFLGKAIVVASEGGASVTTIDARGFNPVVAFLSDEREGSVLRGFTVTGGIATFGAGGIECSLGARPRIEHCIVRANRSLVGNGAGVFGSPILEDCLLEDNLAPAGGGAGVFGAPTMRRCIVRGNRAYEGNGLQLFGGLIVDCEIVDNCCGEGDQGGGVSIIGPGVVMRRCLIARNTLIDYRALLPPYSPAHAGGVYVAPGLAPLLVNCTIVDNIVAHSDGQGVNYGGVFGPARLVNTLVRGNDFVDVNHEVVAVFSNIEGGHPGLGNFDLDPLFVDPAAGDYRLRAGSPCIDSGAPAAPVDPDCTRADVGAFPFEQPCVQVRNGSGANPSALSALGLPALGTSLVLRVDAGAFPGASLTLLAGRASALAPGASTPWGELLIDGSELFLRVLPSTGAFDHASLAIPNDAALLGREAHVQAAVVASIGARLTNALFLRLGH